MRIAPPNSSWDETLVIVTADHETGVLWGPNSDKEPFQPLLDNSPGIVPGLRYHTKTHTNSLVPVFARGIGAELLDTLIVSTDPVRVTCVDNTGIAKAIQAALGAADDQPKSSPMEPRCGSLRTVSSQNRNWSSSINVS